MMEPRPAEELVEAARGVGVTEPRLLDAVRVVRRCDFVPPEFRVFADEDRPIPLPHHQVTTQPSLSARMIEALTLTGTEHVLEVGTGYGYQTALLAKLAGFVTSIERWPDLAAQARHNLAAAGIDNVRVVVGDGTGGVPDGAPYDAVLVSAAFPTVPPPLAHQLMSGGVLVQPIGPGGADEVTLFQRTAEGLVRVEPFLRARFVRLYGRYGYP
ncbi:protein-L-isoaspartate O-methyltransferase [Actinopolymorpha sp. B11F2]|uniref:protein-L-isoaspartate O-methyltransferase family protein n=1 Tax=Actinopolymorpha sp. B11F2 TaxID=3160862 RepID=UPI0032E46F70